MPTPDNQARADQLEKAAIECDKICKTQIKTLANKFYVECTYTIGVPVVAAIITYFFSSAATALAPLAVGAANVVEKTTSSKTLFTTYNKDKSALEIKVSGFLARIRLALQEQDPTLATKDLDAVAKDMNALITA